MDKNINLKILLVGCGKMGSALLSGWLDQNIKASNISVIEPQKNILDIFLKHGVNLYSKFEDLKHHYEPDFVFFAVKPQMMDEIVPDYRCFSGKTTFISIAAGKTITYFESQLGEKNSIIRAMPNIPAAVGRGITVACGNSSVRKKTQETCLALLTAVGDARWLDDESLIDAVTAISGSGPAYVFLLTETMLQAGMDAGLGRKMATELAIKTVAGSGELLQQSSEKISVLRKNVTSPGGTTEAALSVLMGKNGMQKLISEAVIKAIQKSKSLDS
jgi:pyrroline-5-carboxylate reductase